MYAVRTITSPCMFCQDGFSPQHYEGDCYCVCIILDYELCSELEQLGIMKIATI